MELRRDRPYELKPGDFRLKSCPARRLTSQAVRSAARSMAAVGCAARAWVLMRPDEPRSTTTLQRNERIGADSRRMTTSTERILISCGAIDDEEAVLSVRAFVVGDWNVNARDLDSHQLERRQVARHPERLGCEIVLLHLPPQRHRADVQRCRPRACGCPYTARVRDESAPVPVNEDSAGHPWARPFLRWDTSGGSSLRVMVVPCARIAARSIACSSSRTFPGHS